MKSINQIFKDNKSLMDEPEVQKLIDYCLELVESVVDNNQVIDQTVVLKQIIFEKKVGKTNYTCNRNHLLFTNLFNGKKIIANNNIDYTSRSYDNPRWFF